MECAIEAVRVESKSASQIIKVFHSIPLKSFAYLQVNDGDTVSLLLRRIQWTNCSRGSFNVNVKTLISIELKFAFESRRNLGSHVNVFLRVRSLHVCCECESPIVCAWYLKRVYKGPQTLHMRISHVENKMPVIAFDGSQMVLGITRCKSMRGDLTFLGSGTLRNIIFCRVLTLSKCGYSVLIRLRFSLEYL